MRTRYKEIDVEMIEPGLWRYRIEDAHTGPHFRTRAEALAYLDSYAQQYGIARPGPDTLAGIVAEAIQDLEHNYLDSTRVNGIVSRLRAGLNL